MSKPIEIDLPHHLGKDGAKQRIDNGFDKIAGFVPGGSITEHEWTGDTLNLVVSGMGQKIGVTLDVAESNVHASFKLPMMLSMFADQARAMLEKQAPKLLE